MKAKEWPFVPNHITTDVGDRSADIGIISNDHLQGIITNVASRLGTSVTVMEFPLEFQKDPIRTLARSMRDEARVTCSSFRQLTKGIPCNKAEACVANLFRELKPDRFKEQIAKRIISTQCIIDYRKDGDFEVVLQEKNDRLFLELDCPILGYGALAFPIIFQELVIGVLYVGGIIREGNQDLIARKHEKAFDYYARNSPETILILENLNEFLRPTYSQDKYDQLVRKTMAEIFEIERILNSEIEAQKTKYIIDKVRGYNRDFFREIYKIREEKSVRDDSFTLLWDIVKKRLNDVKNDFKMNHIAIFGIKEYSKEAPKILEVVAKAGQIPGMTPAALDTLKFHIGKAGDPASDKIANSIDNPKLFLSIEGLEIDPQRNFIRTTPSPFAPQHALVTWIGFDDKSWNPLMDEHEKASGKILDGTIKEFNNIIAFAHASISVVTGEMLLERSIRVFGHELGQLTTGLDWIRVANLEDYNELKKLSSEKVQDVNGDFESILKLIHFLSEKAKLFISGPKPQKVEFLIFKESLFKWKDGFRMEASKKDVEIEIVRPDSSDLLRPAIFADKGLLDQVIYNLIDNGIKYCHRGTILRIDCRKNDFHYQSPHQLTVTDYGVEIERSVNPYGYGYRGQNVSGKSGSGIGLYIAMQVAVAHGGKISHKVEKISRYNVPLIWHYVEVPFKGKDLDLVPVLKEELRRLKASKLFDEIVAMDDKGNPKYAKPTARELIKAINTHTWKVTFTVEIPGKGVHHENSVA